MSVPIEEDAKVHPSVYLSPPIHACFLSPFSHMRAAAYAIGEPHANDSRKQSRMARKERKERVVARRVPSSPE